MKYLVLFFSLFLTATGLAATKDDFAYGYSLEVDGDGAIYSLYLNEEIYKGMVRDDRRDIRIFNSQGISVPHYLRRMQRQKKDIARVNPPFFPLYQSKGKNSTLIQDVHITTDSHGAIIDINYGKSQSGQRTITGYIVDISALDLIPSNLRFHWPEQTTGFVSALKIEHSNDLNTWQTLVNRDTISHLRYGHHVLVKDKAELPSVKSKYLRVTWLSSAPQNITGISLGFPEGHQLQPRQWSEVHSTHYDAKTRAYYFETNMMIPVDRLIINLPQRNTLIRVNVESAASKKGPWYHRYDGLLYDLQQDGERLVNAAVSVPVNSHNFWRIQLFGEDGQLGGNPVMRFGWVPEQLLFVAQGESPYTLAYGSAQVEPVSAPLSQLLSEQNMQKQQKLIKVAQLGSRIKLGDKSKLQPPKPPVDWKHYILWSVLIVGVLLLAVMAIRLFRQMDQDDTNE